MWETKFHTHTKQLAELWYIFEPSHFWRAGGMTKDWTEWYQAFPKFSLLSVSLWMHVWSVIVLRKYFKFATSSKCLFVTFMLCLSPAFWRDINIYLVFSDSLAGQPPY
jgi:hypothetical protein